jgi:hypothetical protein
MAENVEKKEVVVDEEQKKVQAQAVAKQLRHRMDEYIAMVIAISAVFILWFLQFIGLY